jgi:hypothetical protein
VVLGSMLLCECTGRRVLLVGGAVKSKVSELEQALEAVGSVGEVCRYVGINYQGGCSFGHSLIECTGDSTASEGSLVDAVEHAEMVEKQLDAMIQRRARKGDVDPDEREELWKASVRAYEEKRRRMARLEWHLHHTAQAERLRRTLEALASHHEEQAAKLLDVRPKGA